MKRDIYQKLSAWKHDERRKPLILRGARQVGKTHALRQFAKNAYESHIYINFEKNKKMRRHFEESLEPLQIIKILSIQFGVNIQPEKTLLIFDEIQECPTALNSLKYFCEQANHYHVATAGSLLGIKLSNQHGFPVGKVNFLNLYPLSFFEFLTAIGKTRYREFLEAIDKIEPLPSAIHEDLNNLFKHYLYLGGMPEVIANYIKNDDLNLAREIHQEILDSYDYDFSKHAPPSQVMKINAIWEQSPKQLAKENKKFIFSAISKSARTRDYEEAIHWLLGARMVHKSNLIQTPKLPLSAYTDHYGFKLFMNDVGLLGALSNLSAKTLIEGDRLFMEFNGALIENFVAQELIAHNLKKLYYWSSAGTAEVDFLIEHEQRIFPLEVKAGLSTKKKSLLVYANKYGNKCVYRTTAHNLKHDGKVINYPLYLISRLFDLNEK